MPSQPPPESAPKGGENEAPEDKVTRCNFEALAGGLFRVTPEQYADEERRRREAPTPPKGGKRRT